MRSRAGIFWQSLWLTLLLLLPLVLVVAFLSNQRARQQELRRAAAAGQPVQIQPGAQDVWRILLVVQKEIPDFVLVRADAPAQTLTFCALPGNLQVQAPVGTTTLAECALTAGAGRAAQLLCGTAATGETALPALHYLAATPSCWIDCAGPGTGARFDVSAFLPVADRYSLGLGNDPVATLSASDTPEFIAALQARLPGSSADLRAAVWAAFARQNPELPTQVVQGWRQYSARTLTDLSAGDLLGIKQTLTWLAGQGSAVTDYICAETVATDSGLALTEQGLQTLKNLMQ